LLLRIELANGDAELRPRFEHADAGSAQGQILLIRGIDEPRQHGVIEHRPPIPVFREAGVHRFVPVFNPCVSNRCWRCLEIRAEQTSFEQQRQPEDQDFRLPRKSSVRKKAPTPPGSHRLELPEYRFFKGAPSARRTN